MRTLAGSTPGFRDGPGLTARFRSPAGLAVAAPGTLIVADQGNALVRIIADPSLLPVRPPASPRINPRFDADEFARRPLLWPVEPMEGPHEVAGTLGEVRGGEGSERFHSGIDVRAEEGTPVLAVRDGAVASPVGTDDFGTLNESLRIGPLSYVHVRVGRDRHGRLLDAYRFAPTHDESGTLAGVRVRRGARFSAGDIIATVNAFNHVHVTVGWPGDERNPLAFRLVQFEDTVPPTIPRGGVRLYDEDGHPLTSRAAGRILVTGRVQIVVEAWDQANGNRPERRLGLYDLGYQVLERDGTPAPGFEDVHHTLRLDRLDWESEGARLAYAPGSGIPFYGSRRTRFLYVVTNIFRDGVAQPGVWDTTRLPPGDYIVRAWASDINGNAASVNRDLPVTIASEPTDRPDR
jgi:hypothetical protein